MSLYAGSAEIIQVADVVAREKGIPKDLVVDAIEQALVRPAARQYGGDKDISVHINRRSGDIKTYRLLTVVEDGAEVEDENAEKVIRQKDAFDLYGNAKKTEGGESVPYVPGDVIREELPPIDLRRVTAQIAKQVIIQKIKEAEREREYNAFIERMGEIAHGSVKRVEFGNVVVDLGGGVEAMLARDHVIRGENYNVGDRVRALIAKVRRENILPQILLSRTAPEFMAKLFSLEVPEIYEGIIQIKSVARDPGSRAKFAIYSVDPNIDPVGSCVGVRGSRVQAVSNEILGEKIDIVQWSSDPATFLVNAIAPAKVSKVIINEETRTMDVAVAEEELSIAIGRRGQNVRLASDLIGWRINVMSEEAEAAKRSEDFSAITSSLIAALDVDDIIAHLLAGEGFTSPSEIAFSDLSELVAIEGFDENIAAELQRRALAWRENCIREEEEKFASYGMEEGLVALMGEEAERTVLIALAEADVKTIHDFADLSRDELFEIIGEGAISFDRADALIMKARESWFDASADEQKATS
ncbi:MAG: transcription termination factor NusA [Rickettsiales bacterium]